MAAIETNQISAKAVAKTLPVKLPQLQTGDHYTREEFMRRYEASPEIRKAELINGVVYVFEPMASPVSLIHTAPEEFFAYLLTVYRRHTPLVLSAHNGTIYLDAKNAVQPDHILRIEPRAGGQAKPNDENYLSGAPELVVEIAYRSANYDLHAKKESYFNSGVQEYLVWQAEDHLLHHFIRGEGEFISKQSDADGIFRSQQFPGLWIDATAIGREDMDGVANVLDRGLASPEHAEFVAELKKRAEGAK
jgi:Uma2 family endonuclease